MEQDKIEQLKPLWDVSDLRLWDYFWIIWCVVSALISADKGEYAETVLYLVVCVYIVFTSKQSMIIDSYRRIVAEYRSYTK
jgi:hypothetical protein